MRGLRLFGVSGSSSAAHGRRRHDAQDGERRRVDPSRAGRAAPTPRSRSRATAAPRGPASPRSPALQDKDLGGTRATTSNTGGAAFVYQIPSSRACRHQGRESDYDLRAISSATSARLDAAHAGDGGASRREGHQRSAREHLRRRFTSACSRTCSTAISTSPSPRTTQARTRSSRMAGSRRMRQTRDYVKVTKFYRRYRTIPDVVDASPRHPSRRPSSSTPLKKMRRSLD